MDLWTPTPIPKKRTSRACDVCRRKKIRCDGAEKPDNRCSSCVSHNIECTYESHAQRGSGSAHPGSLEERLMEMESKLSQVQKDHYPAALSGIYPNTKRVAGSADEELEQYGIPELSKNMEDLSIPQVPFLKHYHGLSSSFSYYMLAKILNREADPAARAGNGAVTAHQWKHRRERFWQDREKKQPLPKKIIRPSDASFPHEELGKRLINTFFDANHFLRYMIDRPDFEAKYAHGEHHREDNFAALVFMIFAIGSKYIKDEPAVLKNPEDVYSAGDAYAEAVHPYYRMFQGPVTLEELQGMTLYGFYQFISGRSHPSWVIVGITVRLGLDVGAHRRRPEAPTKEAEYWKRTFWMSYIADVMSSCFLGRITTCSWQDIDLDMPQSLGGEDRPIDYLQCMLQLMKLMDETMRALYTVKRPPILERLLKDDYEQTLVAELDSNLNEWFETLPPRLKWDPDHQPLFDLEQSAQLYCVAYNISQLIHRPFIPTPGNTVKLGIPSLAICTRAARACSNVLNSARKHNLILLPGSVISGFASGITLIIASWSALSAGSKLDYNTHLLDVDKCIRYMLTTEDVYVVAGRHVDILREIADVAGMWLATSADSPPSQKRQRDEDEEEARQPRSRPFSEASSTSPSEHIMTPPLAFQTSMFPKTGSPEAYQPGAPADAYATSVSDGTIAPATADVWDPSALAAFLPPDANSGMNHSLVTHQQQPVDGMSVPMQNGDATYGDPSFWSLQGAQGAYLPQVEAPQIGLNQEALGLWAFAPPTFEWEQWGTMLDSIPYTESGESDGIKQG